MLGIIVTGHGKFASGIGSGIELIAGPQKKFKLIDFDTGMSPEILHQLFIKAIDELNIDDGIIFLTDLAGGTPFNQAAMIKANNKNVGVIAGVNSPLIIEGLFNREVTVDQFIENSLQSGKSGIVNFEMKQKSKVSNSNERI